MTTVDICRPVIVTVRSPASAQKWFIFLTRSLITLYLAFRGLYLQGGKFCRRIAPPFHCSKNGTSQRVGQLCNVCVCVCVCEIVLAVFMQVFTVPASSTGACARAGGWMEGRVEQRSTTTTQGISIVSLCVCVCVRVRKQHNSCLCLHSHWCCVFCPWKAHTVAATTTTTTTTQLTTGKQVKRQNPLRPSAYSPTAPESRY